MRKFLKFITKYKNEIETLDTAHKMWTILGWLIFAIIQAGVYMGPWFKENWIGVFLLISLLISTIFFAYWVFKYPKKSQEILVQIVGQGKSTEESEHLITLEEAVGIFNEKHKLPDEVLQHIAPDVEENSLEQCFFKKLDPKTENILYLLARFFQNGMLSLHGEHFLSKNLEIIPLKDIKNWADDFNALYGDCERKNIIYKGLKCSLEELLTFINDKKETVLSIDYLRTIMV